MKTINITFLLMLFVVRAFSLTTIDSLGVQSHEGKSYIIHKVTADETLYSLLKKYECSVGEVLDANPELKNSSKIYVNQVIKFPTLLKVTTKPKPQTVAKADHIVQAGETLYSISKQYGISLEQLRAINGLMDNNIKSGQAINLDPAQKNTFIASNKVISKPKNILPPVSENVNVMVVPNAPRGELVTEVGIAQVINTGRKSNKHLALHRTAPIGSLMTIKNEATGERVMVKVIGTLPPTGENENVLVRISPSAYNKLKPRDTSLRAEVAYSLPPNSK